MIRSILIAVFLAILVMMLVATTFASLDRSILDVGAELTADPWFLATLADAYFGFITFYVWVCYREATTLGRVVWFMLIMTLGNIAMSVYCLIRLLRWDPTTGARGLLLRPIADNA